MIQRYSANEVSHIERCPIFSGSLVNRERDQLFHIKIEKKKLKKKTETKNVNIPTEWRDETSYKTNFKEMFFVQL